MENKRKALKDILHFSVSTWVNFALGFLSTFVLTRVFLPNVMGTINLFYSTIAAFYSVVCVGMDSGLIRFYNETPNKESVAQFFFKLLSVSIFIAFVLGLISYIFFANNIVELFLDKRGHSLLICIFLGVIDQIILKFLSQSLRMRMDIKRFNIQSILINVVTRFSVIFGALIDPDSAEWAIIMNTLCMTILAAYCLWWQRREWLPIESINYSFKGYKSVFIFSFFSVLGGIAINLNTLASQLVLKNYMGTFAVGIFSSAAVFSAVLTAVKGGFCTYWSAYMYANYKDEEKGEWIKEVHDIVVFASIFLLALFFSFRSIIYLFIGLEFRSSKEYFSLILLYPLLQFICETTQYGLPTHNKAHVVSLIYTLALCVNVGVGAWLVPYLGIAGMAWGNAISGLFCYVLLTILGQHYLKSISNVSRSIMGITIIIVLTICAYRYKTDLPIIISSVMAVSISCLLYKDTVIKTYSLGKQFITR